MSKARAAASSGKGKYRDPSPASRDQDDKKRGDVPQDDKKRIRRRRRYPKYRHPFAYRSTSRVDRLEENHPGLRALVETLMRRRVRQVEIARQVYKRFAVRVSSYSLSRYFATRVQPQEDAEASAYRQAHAQAHALIEEMKADPELDAAKIAEIMLASQIVRDRTKLAEADIMDLYREQRERRKLELQYRALILKEQQTKAVLKKLEGRRKPRVSHEEMVKKIQGIYGLSETPPGAETPGPENSR